MDIDKLLLDIELELGTIQAHIKRMRKKGKEIHRLDVDLMQEKIRRVYDRLSKMEEISPAGKQTAPSIDLPEKMPEAAIPETAKSKQDSRTEAITVKPEMKTVSEPMEEHAGSQAEKDSVQVETEPAETAQPDPDKPEPEKVKRPETDKKPTSEDEQKKTARSTIDLFSETAEETIADKLGTKDDPSIARKMQTRKVDSLKQVIGINEKFLFINELFGGDLGNYNTAIEEFDRIPTIEGTLAHLRELQVSNQWTEDNVAYQKFKSLVERKSAQ